MFITYTNVINLAHLDAKSGVFEGNLQAWWRCWRCVLFANVFEFFFVLKGSNIIHLTQFAQLSQSQTSFTKLAFLRLTVVLRDILISFGLLLI